jgi:hypothetical protein
MNKMPQLTIVFGLLLILFGAASFYFTGMQHVTSLIPAFFGVAFALCGWLACTEKWLKHAMHAAALLGLLGLAGTAKALMKLPALLSGQEVERPLAVGLQSTMAVLCLIYVGLCIWSFVIVRRQRQSKS